MTTFRLLTVFVLLIVIASCNFGGRRINGNGNLKSEYRDANHTDRIKVLGSVDVFVVLGKPAVRVEADENLLPYIETRGNDGWLEVKTRDHYNLNTNNTIKVYITTESLSALAISGSGNITCEGGFTSPGKASFEVTGSGDMIANINASDVDASIRGSGNMTLTGETKDVEVKITGSGDYKGEKLKAENANVSITGSGSANIFADRELKANVRGSGDVRYVGSADVKSEIVGSGTVQKIQ